MQYLLKPSPSSTHHFALFFHLSFNNVADGGPIQLASLIFIAYRTFLSSCTLFNTSEKIRWIDRVKNEEDRKTCNV